MVHKGSAGLMEDSEAAHVPVMRDRIVELLSPALQQPEPVAVDATLGAGGHAEALLVTHERLHLVGIDRDTAALDRGRMRLAPFHDRVDLVHAPFDDIPDVLARMGITEIQALLLDLGVSSPQLDEAERGFSHTRDAPLDMRMDRSQGSSAADVVNTYSAAELTRVLRDYGEERFASRIAKAVVRARADHPIDSTVRLAGIVREAIPAATRRTGGHPAKRTFQALRIEVNAELTLLERALPSAMDLLAVGGRVAVLSYHSLEDRLTKRSLAARATDTTPRDLPVSLPDHQPEIRLLTRGAETPNSDEIDRNPRAASARLRAAERVRRQ